MEEKHAEKRKQMHKCHNIDQQSVTNNWLQVKQIADYHCTMYSAENKKTKEKIEGCEHVQKHCEHYLNVVVYSSC